MSKSLPAWVRQLLRQRSNDLCERCGQKYGTNAHHRKNRSQGGADTLSNLLWLCGSGTTGCHGYITEHPRDSYNHGWSVLSHHNPADIPVEYRGTWMWLDDSGNLQPVEDVI